MTSRSGEVGEDSSSVLPPLDLAANRWRLLPFLMLSAWCGLVVGAPRGRDHRTAQANIRFQPSLLDEPAFRLADPTHQPGTLSHSGPGLVDSCLVHGTARPLVCCPCACALTLLPAVWAALPRIYGAAGFLLAAGIASRLVPVLERRKAGLARLVRLSFPAVAAVAPVLAVYLLGTDQLKAWRENARALPPAGSPNILLIVMDTVAADHLSLHGYNRRTSPTIDELAKRGIRFDRARSTSSWTLLSHSSMFTGRWPHELSAGWFTPLGGEHPTVAEFLASHGYATAGFIGNYWYCVCAPGRFCAEPCAPSPTAWMSRCRQPSRTSRCSRRWSPSCARPDRRWRRDRGSARLLRRGPGVSADEGGRSAGGLVWSAARSTGHAEARPAAVPCRAEGGCDR